MNTQQRPPNQLRKLCIELGPLLVFFIVYSKAPDDQAIFWATGAFMAAILISLVVSWVLEKKLPRMLLTSAVLVLIFGGLTIWLHEEKFIQIKVTVTYALFAVFLLAGLLTGRLPLQWLLESSMPLTRTGWRQMTIAWIVFFAVLAVLNEIIRSQLSMDMWVKFKVFGVLALTLVFSICLAPIISRHMIKEDPEATLPEEDAS